MSKGIVKIEAVSKMGNTKLIDEGENHLFLDNIISTNIRSILSSGNCSLSLTSKWNAANDTLLPDVDTSFDYLIANEIPFLGGRFLGQGILGSNGSGSYIGSWVDAESYYPRLNSVGNGFECNFVFSFGSTQAQGKLNYVGLTNQFNIKQLFNQFRRLSYFNPVNVSIVGNATTIEKSGSTFILTKAGYSSVSISLGTIELPGGGYITTGNLIPGFDKDKNMFVAWDVNNNTTSQAIYFNFDGVNFTWDESGGLPTYLLTTAYSGTKPNISFAVSNNWIFFNTNYQSISSLYKINRTTEVASNYSFAADFSPRYQGYCQIGNKISVIGDICILATPTDTNGIDMAGVIVNLTNSSIIGMVDTDVNWGNRGTIFYRVNNTSVVSSRIDTWSGTTFGEALTAYKLGTPLEDRDPDDGLKVSYYLNIDFN